MNGMFSWCIGLESLDVSGFDTSQVVDMKEMFFGCVSLKSLDISGFDTSNVKVLSVLLPKYLAVPLGVPLKTKKWKN